ncbi:MAG: hypothetical protein IPP15_00210 [Saprospiraceae bacterium]|uniref:Uncharacterized protein n=1 Tax=Candidatus Opimibacter skivensis TaxID=2982028 RepID=A0A9D7SRT4_9BACT|nr:hypothetical protein [Candidatus Opimibacter skivensis]
MKQGTGTKEMTVEMTSWPAGIYFVKIGSQVQKVIRMKSWGILNSKFWLYNFVHE